MSGCTWNMIDKSEIDFLLAAAGSGDVDKLRALIRAGVDVNATNEIGYTALMSASRSYRVAAVAYLLKCGASVDNACTDGVTALHTSVGESPSEPEQQTECVKLLIKAGASIDPRTNSGLTPLMSAAWFGCSGSFKVLLEAGASLSLQDEQGRTAEDLATIRDRGEILQIIASLGTT